MSKFTTPLKLEFLDYKNFKLLESFEYYRENDNNDKIIVPTNFITDFATVPKIFWSILPPNGTKKNRYGKSAVLHDYCYDKSCKYNFTRKEADDLFLESMKAVGVSKIVRYTLYYCVRWFGKSHYKS